MPTKDQQVLYKYNGDQQEKQKQLCVCVEYIFLLSTFMVQI